MEHNKPKFHLRLNLFDGIVLVLTLCAAAFLAWNTLKPESDTGEAGAVQATVRYTLRLGSMPEGVGQRVHPGDTLTDNIRNYELGTVVSCDPRPAEELMLNETRHELALARVDGYEDLYIEVESPCTVTPQYITVGGGYTLQVGKTVYVRGAGYMGTSTVVAIEREGLE